MPEEAAVTEPVETEPVKEPTVEDEQRIPYPRFKEVNDKLVASQTELDELRKWKDEQEAAKLSEIERATKERDDALAAAQAATERATKLERSGWVTDAARKAGFTDPTDAAVFLDLGDLEDEKAAGKAVEVLGKSKPHLLSKAKPQGFGALGGSQDKQTPLDDDGKPDLKAGLGAELARNLLG